jgi:hypothetical protein
VANIVFGLTQSLDGYLASVDGGSRSELPLDEKSRPKWVVSRALR